MTDERDTSKGAGPVPLTDAEVEAMLEAYGADAARWPKQDGARELKPALRLLQRETRALDRILARGAVAASVERERLLADRIVAAALRTPRVAPVRQPEAALPAAAIPKAKPEVSAPPVNASSIPRFTRRADISRSLALLAASLIIGVSIGQSGLSDRAFAGIEDITGISLASSDVAAVLSAADSADED